MPCARRSARVRLRLPEAALMRRAQDAHVSATRQQAVEQPLWRCLLIPTSAAQRARAGDERRASRGGPSVQQRAKRLTAHSLQGRRGTSFYLTGPALDTAGPPKL
eukprot:6181149-Pleurochrysis_carterae.AAC.3